MDREKKKQLIIKICCVVAAIGLRFYVSNVENPIIRYTVRNVPVNVMNEERLKNSGLILKKEEAYTVDLTVKGATNQVKKLTPKDFKVTADLESLALKNGKNRILVSVEDYPNGVNVIENQQMLITIDLDDYIDKEFRVNVTLKGAAKEGYYAHETSIIPEVIKIAGGEEQIQTINKVIAEIDLKEASNDINKEIELKIIDATGEKIEGLTLFPNKIKVRVPINKTKSVPIIINSKGELDGAFKLKSTQQNVKTVKVSGDEADLKILEGIETEPLELKDITESQVKKLSIKVPKGITVIDGTKEVEVKIEIENIIEKSIINLLRQENLEEGLESNLQYSNVNITIKGVESILNDIDYRNIECIVDMTGLKEGTHVVPVTIKVPENVEVISSDVETVKVDIIKKQEEEESTDDSASENGEDEAVDETPDTEDIKDTEKVNGIDETIPDKVDESSEVKTKEVIVKTLVEKEDLSKTGDKFKNKR